MSYLVVTSIIPLERQELPVYTLFRLFSISSRYIRWLLRREFQSRNSIIIRLWLVLKSWTGVQFYTYRPSSKEKKYLLKFNSVFCYNSTISALISLIFNSFCLPDAWKKMNSRSIRAIVPVALNKDSWAWNIFNNFPWALCLMIYFSWYFMRLFFLFLDILLQIWNSHHNMYLEAACSVEILNIWSRIINFMSIIAWTLKYLFYFY
jgi:hypothetical protein